MSSPNFNHIPPIGPQTRLPRLMDYHDGIEGGNGIVKKLPNGFHQVQYVPSDHPKYWSRESNQHLLKIRSNQHSHRPYNDPDEMLYTTNNRNFRTPDNFEKSMPGLMSLGCSHTFGVGVRDHEAWPQRVANALNLPNWNLGSGGQGVDYCIWVARAFFDKGYIPKAVAVWWPDLYRTLIVSDNASRVEEDIMSTIIDGIPGNKLSKDVFPISPADPRDDLPLDVKLVAKGHFAKSEMHIVTEFLIKREYLILLCRAHNVPIVEYVNDRMAGFDDESLVQQIDEKSSYKIPQAILANDTENPNDAYKYYQRKGLIVEREWCPDIFNEVGRDASHSSGTFMKELADRFEISFKENYTDFA